MPPKSKDELAKLQAELTALEVLGPEDRDAEAREASVQDALAQVFVRLGAHVDGAEARARVASYAADRLAAASLDFVDLLYVPREDASTEAPAEAGLNNWLPDHEPAAAPIDTWARGAVPSRRAVRVVYPIEDKPVVVPKAPGTKTLRSQGSTTDAGEPAKGADGKDGLARSSKRPQLKPIARDEATGAFREARSPQAGAKGGRLLSEEESRREARLRDEIEGRKAIEAIRRQQVEKDARDVQALQTLQQELRGKEYGYDHRGAVVVISKVELDKLPPVLVGPRVAVRDPRADAEAEAEGDKKKRGAAAGAAMKKPADGAKKKAGPQAVELIPLPPNMTPSLADTMKVVPGVTLREGPAVRTGGRVPDNGLMSRREFLQLVAMQRSMDKFASDFNGGGAAEPAGTPRAPGSGGGAGAGGLTGTEPGASGAPEPEDEMDFNLTLANAPDWGINTMGSKFSPRALPSKISERQRELATGKRPWAPRDRPLASSPIRPELAALRNAPPLR